MEKPMEENGSPQDDRKVLIITCVAMMVLLYGVIGGYTVFYSQQQYNNAQRLIAEERWQEAIEVLDEIPNYRDAKDLRQHAVDTMNLGKGQTVISNHHISPNNKY